jgi:[acyl-carrier-protein] S-malonyltransferase
MMKYCKVVLIFPGQGSQYAGMGKELYTKFKVVRDIYDEANSVLGYDLSRKCFRRPKLGTKIMHWTDLDKTIYTQPAVLTTSYACYKVFEQRCKERKIDLDPIFLAGHSLGEYTALSVAGAMDFKTTVGLVHKRASFITQFSESYPDAGLMAIVDKKNGLADDRIDHLCKDFQVYVTLINTRSQVVVGGFRRNLTELSKKLRKDGVIATLLRVEGPFHTPLMKPAADRFQKELEKTEIYIASKPVIANVTTNAIVDPTHIRKELYKQIFTFVDWRSSIQKAVANGADLFIEIGPKTVLSNMIKDIDSSVPSLNVEDVESLEKTLAELKK